MRTRFWPRVYSVASRSFPLMPGLAARLMHSASLRTGEPELHLVPEPARRDGISIEIGAKWGVYTASMLRSSARVVAFEPNPFEAARLRAAFPRAEVHQCALGSTAGSAILHVPLNDKRKPVSGLGSLNHLTFQRTDQLEVEVRRLDDFDFRDVGFIKIDVEGLEQQVLDGAWRTIARDRPNLLIEANGEDAVTTLARRMADAGYAVTFLYEGEELPFERWSPRMRGRHGLPPYNFIMRAA